MNNNKQLYAIYDENKKIYGCEQYFDAFELFNSEVKNKISDNSGAFITNGLPYSYGANIWCLVYNDDNSNLSVSDIQNLENIYELFNLIGDKDVLLKNKEFINKICNNKDDEWTFKIERKDEEVIISICNGDLYLKTNLFSSYNYLGDRYFSAHLKLVCGNKGVELGKIVDVNLHLKALKEYC